MKTLNRLLIANRGEIALRIARSARALGIATIAVCSDADRDAPHVAGCDEVMPLGGNSPAESYLSIDKLLAAAARARAQGIHPGYGFLSENAAFARSVADAGLVFVGPPSSAIAAMGDKARARRAMAAAGIPIVEGYDGDPQDEATFVGEAERIGYPVMIKAAAGGGGRGMRLVQSAAQLPEALRAAASEAAKAFGDGRLILERAVPRPRHVEIQVLGDEHGQLVHLGERDCSVQRRHQKIVEESPSPAVDPVLRERMGRTAVAIARQVGYFGAGTVEFLLDGEGRFYFMEMNTRLQVEHPVTELVTGLDLVALQLRVARGERLPLAQQDVRLDGHAIEVRLCAEDPAADFLPCSGEVADWSPPSSVRCDHAVTTGMNVSPWYDSMLAKLVAHGGTRAEAIDRLALALDRTVLLGVPSNRAFLATVLRDAAFADGTAVSTAFLEERFPEPRMHNVAPDARAWALAAWLSVAAATESESVPRAWHGWTAGPALPLPWRLERRVQTRSSDLPPEPQSGRVFLGSDSAVVEAAGEVTTIHGRVAAAREFGHADVGGVEIGYRYAWQGDTLWLHTGQSDVAFRCLRRRAVRSGGGDGVNDGEVRASINGRVAALPAAVGREVRAGETLVVLEAMKMEHEVHARRAGRISAVGVGVGDQVTPGQWLVRIEVDC